jgi:phosphoribosyl-ATP pyrophosphohydrolase/phosphoribosyl-AMP cyclohydrolase
VKPEDIESLAWAKGQGLLPVVVQHADNGTVLMTAFVNREALQLMLERHELVLYSRTRQQLWVKGETSGNRIAVDRVVPDCDRDALLVFGRPMGPACHTGASSCFEGAPPEATGIAFLRTLEGIVASRLAQPSAGSYTASLAAAGIRRIAQKVAEEGLEVALAASASDVELIAESADLIFHMIVLLKSRDLSLAQVARELETRHAERQPTRAEPSRKH